MAAVRPFIPVTPDELLVGYGLAEHERVVLPQVETARSLASALIDRVSELRAGEPTCFVAFSGGVDSTLLLSALTHAARRDGLPDPVPLTWRFADAPAAEESQYQEFVVAHLGLREWRIEQLRDQFDLVGPAALETMKETGLLYPAMQVAQTDLLRRLGPCVEFKGEGGDGILGPRRISAARLSIRFVAHRDWAGVKRKAGPGIAQLLPSPVRRATALKLLRTSDALAWVRPDVRGRLLRSIAAEEVDEPLLPGRYGAHYLSAGATRVAQHNAAALRARFGIRLETPLLDPVFLAQLEQLVPWYRWTNRSEFVAIYFPELVPERIARRTSKAYFAEAYFNTHTRRFIDRWDGRGLPDSVDRSWLREHWRTAPHPHGGTSLLLQAAALHEAGIETKLAA